MADSLVQALQTAVRLRLWRGQFVAAARLALWVSAGLMLLAVVVHLAARPVRVDTVLAAIVALWTSMMTWAGLRRPSDSTCALWADRHLGGESAFSTLLEMREGRQVVPNAQAMRWLENWAAARVSYSLRQLGGRRESARLSRPLLSMLACTALATIVLMLPGTVPSARQELAAPSPSGDADRPADAEPPASTELVSALANALRSADSRRATERRDDSRAPAARPGKSDVGTGFRMTQPGAAPPGDRTTLGGPPLGTAGDAAPTAGAKQTSGAASGRDAGDSHDDRADAGVSRVARSTIEVQRRESSERRPSPERQADMDQLATFDDDLPMPRTATERGNSAPAAATPPPATAAAPLTPTKAAYVQAWMNASRQRR
ncbi:MAG: hypothetical protein ABI886_11145 [Betaproteobacteria bacterium]